MRENVCVKLAILDKAGRFNLIKVVSLPDKASWVSNIIL